MIIAPALHVSSMILIEIVKLIVYMNWLLDFFSYIKGQNAGFSNRGIFTFNPLIVLYHYFLYVFAHNVEGNTKAEKDETKDSKGDHG